MKKTPLKVILFVAFVDLVGFGLIIPLLPVYAKRMDASGLTLGMLIGVYSLMQLVFNPLLGRWSDRVGRRRVLLISVGGSVISHLVLGFADISVSLPLLFLARILDGITGANVATAQAYIADVTTAENRAKGMGLFGAAFGVGFVVGPAIGAGLAWLGTQVSGQQYGTSWPAFGAAAIALIAFVLVWRLLPESRERKATSGARSGFLGLRHIGTALASPRLREVFVIVFYAVFAFVLLEVTFVYLCIDTFAISATGTGLIFAYIGVLMVIVQGGLVHPLARRFGEPLLVSIGPFITATGFLLLSTVPSAATVPMAWTLLLVACVPVALGQGLTTPNANALISRLAGEDRQGVTLGLSQGIGSLARAIAPPVGGYLYDRGAPLPYWIGAAMLVAVGCFALYFRSAQQRELTRLAESAPTDEPR